MRKSIGFAGMGLVFLAGASLYAPNADAATPAAATTPAAASKPTDRRVLSSRQVDDSADAQNAEFQKLAEDKRLQSIDFLKQLLSQPDMSEGDQKAEMMLRLADLYFQEGRYKYLLEMADFDKKVDACFNTKGCDYEKMKADNTVSADWQGKSIKLYQLILRNYPRYSRADEAIYYLASAMQDTGQADSAVEQYTSLVKQYPDSTWVPDSYVAIGEYWFNKNEAYKALLAYKKATAYTQSSMYAFANYKLAWCYYNVGEYGQAIDTMKGVVALSQAQDANGGGASKSKLQLQDEALKDLVRFFADAGQLDEAYEYFNKLGKKDLIRDMLKRLASTYFEQGKFDQCVETYRRLIAENPTSPDDPDYESKIIEAYKKIGNKDQVLAEIDRLMKDYGKNSAWARANASNTDATKSAADSIELVLRQTAVDWHTEAKKLGTGDEAKKDYALAYKAYKAYLDNYPDGQHTYEVRYAYAELLYKIKHYDEAYDQYMAVVKADPNGTHGKFCAESAIFAADEMVKQTSGSGAAASGSPIPGGPDPGAAGAGALAPIPLTEWEQKLIDACGQYATLYPTEKKNNQIIYKSAYLLYNKHHFTEAAEQFNKVIAMDPTAKQAEQAAHLILDSFKVAEDYENLKKYAKSYYDQPNLGSKQFKTEVYEIYERTSFKLIEVHHEKDKNDGAAADAFIAFYKEFPTSDVAAQAVNNATVYYKNAGRVTDEMATRHILVDGDPTMGPKTKYYYDQVAALGYDYESIADFGHAAFWYEKMYSLYKTHVDDMKKNKATPDDLQKASDQAADGLYSAAVFQRAAGKWEQAINDYNQFVGAFPTDKRDDDIRVTVCKTYEDQKQYPQAATAYYNFYTKAVKDTPIDFVYFARLHYGKMLDAQGQHDKAMSSYAESVETYKKYLKSGGQPGPQTEFVAEMMYDLAQPKFDKYMALKIDAPSGGSHKVEDTALKTNLTAKTNSLKDIDATYTDIIKTGSGQWGLASLVRLGQVYENMGDSLKHSHIPSYLDKDQTEMYTMALEDRSYPMIEKAVAAYSAALGKSYDLTLYNDNTAFATRRLGELRPDDYPGLEEELLQPRYTSSTSHQYDFEPSL